MPVPSTFPPVPVVQRTVIDFSRCFLIYPNCNHLFFLVFFYFTPFSNQGRLNFTTIRGILEGARVRSDKRDPFANYCSVLSISTSIPPSSGRNRDHRPFFIPSLIFEAYDPAKGHPPPVLSLTTGFAQFTPDLPAQNSSLKGQLD